MTADERQAAIDANASTPQSIQTPSGSMTSQDLDAQIRWDNRQRALEARKSRQPGIGIFRIRGSNCVDG